MAGIDPTLRRRGRPGARRLPIGPGRLGSTTGNSTIRVRGRWRKEMMEMIWRGRRRRLGPVEGLRCRGDQREAIRFSMVGRKKDFKHMERVDGRWINVLEGLELHTGVFSAAEQKRIVACVYDVQEKGRNRQLRRRTYSEPRKWMRGKGRVTIQFGCCYNYAVDNYGNPPGIIQDEEVDPMPPLLKTMIKRMVAWHVLPPTCVPDSCIINIYDKDDCIPPHIDHHDFLRPFCTVSLLSKCNILFGRELKIMGPGEFSGSTAIPLPVGSVLVLNGNGADVAKHCVPAVPH
ncbi:RNA demethylase ALKBH9B-like [Phoenix dactylifera]|uniref:RNA demethylase ALKBH9B-like n=1 Tax=Phoenix dactylifera TaxID=42345 RepID=A0A8B9AZ26_PHODC|nr:RNA demethylase ALKBH9B-like [Phoenix dactylifera]